MKTEHQILEEIIRLEDMDVSPLIDRLTRINALLWVLNGDPENIGKGREILNKFKEEI
jgi:hypothetical protein